MTDSADSRLKRLTALVPGVMYQFQRWPDGRMIAPFATESLHRVFDVDPAEPAADASVVFEHVHPDDLPGLLESIEVSARDLTVWDSEYRYHRADGRWQWHHGRAMPERLADGSTLWHGLVMPIDERKAVEDSLEQRRQVLEHEVAERTRELVAARDAAQQASRAKTEFLSSMSHELRTPLNAILGFSQLLELDRDLGERSRAHLREVMRAGRHLLRLINEVLDLAQVESGRLALSPEALRLHELVQDAAALTDPLARPRGLHLVQNVPQDLIVLADRMRLKQVLVNLLTNAAKYSAPGSRVDVQAHAQGPDRVRLVVRDQGPGIPPERMDQLFQPFSRLGAERGSVEGTGIGLALSRRLMELMAGNIGVESPPGQGADFWIELPATQLAAPPPPAEGEPAAAGWPQVHETLVLYVEDNPANLALVEQILARHGGVRLISADDGPQGLALAREQQPALILMDIHLPVMDGYEVLARLRADPATRTIPVVALTAQAMPHDARRAIQAGFDEYVSKPIDVPVFDTLLRRFLSGKPPHSR
jgi:signal transduction histidine kinase/ActR/RegA family two-component response regulator